MTLTLCAKQGPCHLHCTEDAGHTGQHIVKDERGNIVDSWTDAELHKLIGSQLKKRSEIEVYLEKEWQTVSLDAFNKLFKSSPRTTFKIRQVQAVKS